jgi:predicted small secreted protein
MDMRRVVIGLLALGCGLALAACNPVAGDSAGNATPPADAPSDAPVGAPAAPSGAGAG